MQIDGLVTSFCGLDLHSPLVLASGIWGSCAETLIRLGHRGAGAVTSKSCSLAPRIGHPNPTVVDWGCGLMNAIGLANPGAVEERAILRRARAELHALGVPLIASVYGHTVEDFSEAVRLVAEAEPEMIELNISCPNVQAEFGRPFALDAAAAARVTAAARTVFSRYPAGQAIAQRARDRAGGSRSGRCRRGWLDGR